MHMHFIQAEIVGEYMEQLNQRTPATREREAVTEQDALEMAEQAMKIAMQAYKLAWSLSKSKIH